MMKRILRQVVLAITMTVIAVSCSDKEESVEPTLDVTPNNIAGCWRLDSWSGGAISLYLESEKTAIFIFSHFRFYSFQG